jgi:hypothetical protein
MAPPKAIQKGKIVVVFIEPGKDGAPNTVAGTYEVLVDLPEGGAR